VRELWLEDALAATGFRVGPGSRWAKRKLPKADSGPNGGARGAAAGAAAQEQQQQQVAGVVGDDDESALGWDEPDEDPQADGASSSSSSGVGAAAGGGGAAGVGGAAGEQYSADVMRSVELMDASLVNYDLIELLVAHIVGRTQRDGPAAMLQVGLSFQRWARAGVGNRQRDGQRLPWPCCNTPAGLPTHR
jgi:hypothetical protein